MEFAGYTFSIDEYDNTLYSLEKPSLAFKKDTDNFSYDMNTNIVKTKASNNAWEKAILFTIINYDLILKLSKHITNDGVKYHWWTHDFTAIWETLVTNKPFINGTLEIKPSTIITNTLKWSAKMYEKYNPTHFLLSANKYTKYKNSVPQIQIIDNEELIKQIDTRYWINPDWGVLTERQAIKSYIPDIKMKNHRFPLVLVEHHINGKTYTEIGKMLNLTNTRIGQIDAQLIKYLIYLIDIKKIKKQELKAKQPNYHDEHNNLYY